MAIDRDKLEEAARKILILWDGNELAPHHSADIDAIHAAFGSLRFALDDPDVKGSR